MSTRSLLRIASIVVLLFGIGHSLGYPWVGEVSARQSDQIRGVRSKTAVTQGFLRSYWDFHVGFGITISLLFLVQAIILNFMFFFWAPIVCSAILSVCLIAASARAWRNPQ